ncbi:MAG: hypothetical protein ACI9W4_000936, partial [Rhodothermales bacterium]
MVEVIPAHTVSGSFVTLQGERYYAIGNVDKMPPFFISVVSDGDHWMFIASDGALTAGRVSPNTALFPYVTVDKIYDSTPNTGSKTVIRVETGGRTRLWEPFNREHNGMYDVERNVYKTLLGNKLLFEEINRDLDLVFRYSWSSSDEFGFVRESELENTGASDCRLEVVDGLQNLLPASAPRFAQTNSSYLVDAYKWTEKDEETGLAMFTLFSGITDKAEPSESLKANTVFCLGLADRRVLLSSQQLDGFRSGRAVEQESQTRGIRGAYLVHAGLTLEAGASERWQLVADIEQSQAEVVALKNALGEPAAVASAVSQSVEDGSDALARIMAASDGFQLTEEENVTAHHYANVLFNVLRGGIFDDHYQVSAQAFAHHVRTFNQPVFDRHEAFLTGLLADQLGSSELMSLLREQTDPQLERLGFEYLPLTFGRRHGDPSRPWNHFAINLKDEAGNRLLTYEGNWRDIFQNWEALLLSYPEFAEHMIGKFVNASTVDGYNPYRITNEGIDWEVEEPDDPWSYIGYWGDHQIIYLLKLLEWSQAFHPDTLGQLLGKRVFSYANVPYRIKPLGAVIENARSTVDYDEDLAEQIEERIATIGFDGRLVLDKDGSVYQVTLLEKLFVPLLAKLGNLVVDGGIWMNTQRPEWNDANNALVGQGLSMVTLCYMRRYLTFLQPLVEGIRGDVTMSDEVWQWLDASAAVLAKLRAHLGQGPISSELRYEVLTGVGEAASQFRSTVYAQEGFSGASARSASDLSPLLADALAAVDHSIQTNRREDGLYEAYNLISLEPNAVDVDHLYAMLEGQVAALSSGAITPSESVDLLETLFGSELFRQDQKTFLLYPDRPLPRYLEKNQVPADGVQAIPLLVRMLEDGDASIIQMDASGCYRFNSNLKNVEALNQQLADLKPVYASLVGQGRAGLQGLYEQVFDHQSFTGRSGGMFGFEGLGSIYWHMVSKLLLAAQEQFFAALDQGSDVLTARRLGELYYSIREGIGFNKTPAEYGAFPTDPYSHTPGHAGAQQPGMTGQVKEEMITRFAELGVRVAGGAVSFQPALLREREFISDARPFRYLGVGGDWQELEVPASGLAFTWCQVPLVYTLGETPS